jgi:exopolysaccharide biosynthesis polyprenyl glycosylphosphotransferase
MASPEFTHWSVARPVRYPEVATSRPLGVESVSRRSAPAGSPALVWMLADCATVAISALLATYLHRYLAQSSVLPSSAQHYTNPAIFYLYMAGFALVLVAVNRSYGLYEVLMSRSRLREQRLAIEASLTAGLILAGALYFTREDALSRAVVTATILLSTVLMSARRAIRSYITYKQFEQGVNTRNVLIVGTGIAAAAVQNHLQRVRRLGYTCKGFVRTEQDHACSVDAVLGDVSEISRLVRQYFIDDIFITGPCERGTIKQLLAEATACGVDVRVVPDLYDGISWHAPVEYVGQFPTLPLHRKQIPVLGLMAKRTLDMAVSIFALATLAPLMAVIALAVRLDSAGPVFYAAERIGRKGRTFRCMKFRTMVVDAEARKEALRHMNERDGVLFKIRHDPRVTRLGAFLRKYSLDELPQFWNVLIGDMSIVGPRPPLAGEVRQYDLHHLRRLDVQPGITGLWQVNARQDPSFDNYISLDTAYVDNWSLWLDLKIMTRTFGVVLNGTGN